MTNWYLTIEEREKLHRVSKDLCETVANNMGIYIEYQICDIRMNAHVKFSCGFASVLRHPHKAYFVIDAKRFLQTHHMPDFQEYVKQVIYSLAARQLRASLYNEEIQQNQCFETI